MKVAHVTLYPPRGKKHISSSGVASYSKNLLSNIVGEQAVICEVTTHVEQYDEDSIDVRRVFYRKPSFVWQVHRELKKINPDVIHIQQELALFGGVITAYLLQWLVFLWRKKVVITLHGVVDPHTINQVFVHENNSRLPVWIVRLAFRFIYTPLMKWSKTVIVHEKYFKNIIVQSYGISPKKVKIVPHGVESIEKIDKQIARRRLGLIEQADIVLFMGYATGYKGLDLLIEGFSLYAQQNPRSFLVIGAGPHPKLSNDPTYQREYARLQKKAAKLIPESQYQWRGFIPEEQVALYYSACDVSLYPYTTAIASSGPMSFAIGAEAPFLVSTAFADIFADIPHVLFERTAESLQHKLDHFFTHHDDYLQVSSQLKQQRTWQTVGQKTVEVYEEVLL